MSGNKLGKFTSGWKPGTEVQTNLLPEQKVWMGPMYLYLSAIFKGYLPGDATLWREVDILLACTATRLPPTPEGGEETQHEQEEEGGEREGTA